MSKMKAGAFALVVLAAGWYGFARNSQGDIPADLRDAVADNGEFDTSLPVLDKNSGNIPEPKAEGVGGITKGYAAGTDPSAGVPTKPVEFITIPGGKFMMGADSGGKDLRDALPRHEVAIKTFDMAKTEVTVEQYAECVIKGGCTEPDTGDHCNWGVAGRQLHPVNCVDWDQASAYAKFKGARLPSESEWEYAATSGGKDQKYPWGNNEPTSELAVINGKSTMPVCSKSKGNTAQGLCDMAGNLWEWVQDNYLSTYEGVPVDGSAFVSVDESLENPFRVARGGSFYYHAEGLLRVYYRHGNLQNGPGSRAVLLGFRLARSR